MATELVVSVHSVVGVGGRVAWIGSVLEPRGAHQRVVDVFEEDSREAALGAAQAHARRIVGQDCPVV